jgi:hypothetical protein
MAHVRRVRVSISADVHVGAQAMRDRRTRSLRLRGPQALLRLEGRLLRGAPPLQRPPQPLLRLGASHP